MSKRKLFESLLFFSGTVEMLAGAAMSAFPNFAPSWVSFLCLLIGAISLVCSLIVLRRDVWDWLLDKVEQRANAKTGAETRVADLRASNSDAVRAINASPEDRDRLMILLQNGEVKAWSRTQGFRNLRPVPPNFWLNSTLEFADFDGEQQSLIAPHGYGIKQPWRNARNKPPELTPYYDVYFSKAQLKKLWKEKSF